MDITQLDTRTLITRLIAILEETGGPVALVEDEEGVKIGVLDIDPESAGWLEGWQPLPLEDVAAPIAA